MLTPDYTAQFRRDYKLSEKRGLNMTLIDNLIYELTAENVLDEKYCDHSLKGGYKGCRECHIKPDWLLVYRLSGKGDIVFVRTGTHSDIFSE